MDIQFIASVAVITPDPQRSRELFIDALGLPLQASPGSEYFHSERIEGSKHFGIWPLAEAAQACFGTPDWPAEGRHPVAKHGLGLLFFLMSAVYLGAFVNGRLA